MTASDTPLTSDFGGRGRYDQGADRGEVGAPPRPLDTPTTSVQEVPGMTRAEATRWLPYDSDARAQTGECSSFGPRDRHGSRAYCRKAISHDGQHAPAPEDGWGQCTWGDL